MTTEHIRRISIARPRVFVPSLRISEDVHERTTSQHVRGPSFGKSRFAYTLVELLVVIASIGLLVSLMLPTIRGARDAARRATCANNMMQVTLATLNYESAYRNFPPGSTTSASGANAIDNVSWGVHGRLLPYIEQSRLAKQVSVNVDWRMQPAAASVAISTFTCPSDPNAERVLIDTEFNTTSFPTSYGFNFGVWFIFDPQHGRGGPGLFHPNSRTRMADISDGISTTLLNSEVHAWTPYCIAEPSEQTPLPRDSMQLASLPYSKFFASGHASWPSGRVFHSGFTTALQPNARLDGPIIPPDERGPLDKLDYAVWNSEDDLSQGVVTHAAVGSRSSHASIVQVTFSDGHCSAVSDEIDLQVWRALSTKSGNELLTSRKTK